MLSTQIERPRITLEALSDHLTEMVVSGRVSASIITPPRTKGYVSDGTEIIDNPIISNCFANTKLGLEMLAEETENLLKQVKGKEDRIRKHLSKKGSTNNIVKLNMSHKNHN